MSEASERRHSAGGVIPGAPTGVRFVPWPRAEGIGDSLVIYGDSPVIYADECILDRNLMCVRFDAWHIRHPVEED